MAITLLKYAPAPVNLSGADKYAVRTQFATLCYRLNNGKPQILLVTSRRTKRWIIPKGWPMDGKTPADAAAIEAYEEAGAKGRVYDICLGVYSYAKTLEYGDNLPILAMVYPMKVKQMLKDFPEAGQRQRKWFGLKKAASRISEPELRQIILAFDPKSLRHR